MTGNGSGSGSGSGSSTALRNHPFRLEVQEITPVSASILWSLRPPPLSAIPRNLLRQQKQPAQRNQATSSNASYASSSSQSSRLPVNRLANETGVTATRSVNRKVTKVTLRNMSPSKHRILKQNQAGMEHEDWPSDDGATAVDEEEVREEEDADHDRTLDEDASRLHQDDYSEASDEGTASAKIFDSGVSVCVNGVPWSQVMMGDRGTDEAFMVIYGLTPSRDYELLLSVEGKESATVVLSTTPLEREDKAVSTVIASLEQSKSPSASVQTTPTQIVPRLRTHTPPMQDTEASPIEISAELFGAHLGAAATTTTSPAAMSTSTLQASIRRARKDASRAESALRSEIEAIKRGLERMSDVDHRSKQKVLALQESIRQATLHAKDIDEESIAVEKERGTWEEREKEKDEELGEVRTSAEESLKQGDAKMKQDDEEVEAVEKELQKVTRLLEEKWTAKIKAEREKVAEVEQELMRVQMEIEQLLRPQAFQQSGGQYYYNNASPTQLQNRTATNFPSSQVTANRGKGRGSSRGGNRSASNSAAIVPTSRRNFNRTRAQGQVSHSSASDEPLLEYHGSSSSSTHGSILNPHNPEFVPASASPVAAKSSTPTHTEYSPSVASRFAFSSTPLYNREQDGEKKTSSLGSVGYLSPHLHSATPWTVGSTNTTSAGAGAGGGTSLWSHSSVNPSPTLGHDIWGAPINNSNSSATSPVSTSINHSPIMSLHTKTSVPFGLNASIPRNAAYLSSNPSEDNDHPISHLTIPFNDEVAGRRGSAPVSPTFPS